MDTWAVRIKGHWHIAHRVEASAYGPKGVEMAGGRRVWSSVPDAAWLGIEGEEEGWAFLEDTVTGVGPFGSVHP